MISVEIDRRNMAGLMRALDAMDGRLAGACVARAAKRGAVAGRLAGIKKIREFYTIKSGDIKKRTTVYPISHSNSEGYQIKIKGPFEAGEKYHVRGQAHGIFVEIKKSRGTLVPRSFKRPDTGSYVMRVGRERGPLVGLYGPAVPQLFGNPEVVDAVEKRAMEVYENRLLHELERLVGV